MRSGGLLFCIAVALALTLTSGPGAAGAAQPENGGTPEPDEAARIQATLERYAGAVNERNLKALLEVYAGEASINATIAGEKRFYPLAEYALALPGKFQDWDASAARIHGFEIVSLTLNGDVADVAVKAKGSRLFLTGTLEGRARLIKTDKGWKIICDDL